MNKLRLILNDEVVGYQESRPFGEDKLLSIFQCDKCGWFLKKREPGHFIPHDAEDRSTGETDSKGVGIFENDEVV